MYIYKIVNKINGKIYIGLTTTSVSKRFSCYKSETKMVGKRSKQILVEAMKKDGIENFSIETVDRATDKESLKKKEIYYIALFNSTDPSIGYNVSPGGDLHSDETIKKRSLKSKGRPHNELWKQRISEGLKGHKMSEEAKAKSSLSHMGQKAWNKGRKRVVIDGKIKFIIPETNTNG